MGSVTRPAVSLFEAVQTETWGVCAERKKSVFALRRFR
jgi:hypothetical protein